MSLMTFNELKEKLKLPESDLVVVTDGSGTQFFKHSGWTAILFFENNQEILYGAENLGSNNYAECTGTFNALWYYKNLWPLREKVKVSVISDSEWIVKTGNGIFHSPINHNGIFFKAIDFARSEWKYDINFYHVHRNTNEYNTLCDTIAGMVRKILIDNEFKIKEKTGVFLNKEKTF
jgi:ribonuclease HI